MTLYNNLHSEYDSKTNGGNEDYYHGEYDDKAYGNLYIPRIEAADATFETVKHIFLLNNIGLVTSVEFSELAVPKSYRGKNTKQLYRANVYIKWFVTPTVTEFRKNVVLPGNGSNSKDKSRVIVDEAKDTYWVVHANTAYPSEELFEERCVIADLQTTAEDVALRALEEDTEEENSLYELEQTARAVVMQALYEDADEENSLYELEQTARAVALTVLN